MMFMLWHIFINSDDLDSALSSYTLMNSNFLSQFLNVATRNFRMSRGGRLLLDWNLKGYRVAENIDKNVKVNSRMLSTLKNLKSI